MTVFELARLPRLDLVVAWLELQPGSSTGAGARWLEECVPVMSREGLVAAILRDR